MLPPIAMPIAAPTSRIASLTAAATPCSSTGMSDTIAEVAGAVDSPSPAAAMNSGHRMSQYPESTLSRESRIMPTAIPPTPTTDISRRPTMPVSRGAISESSRTGTAMGASAIAAPSAS